MWNGAETLLYDSSSNALLGTMVKAEFKQMI